MPTRPLPTCADVLIAEGLGDPEVDPVHVLWLAPTAEAPRDARIFAWGVAPPLDDEDMAVLGLLTSELVTNAVLHARTELTYGIAITARTVLVAVGDATAAVPVVDDGPARGRGMSLVQSLAERWGVHQVGRGKVVWFTMTRRAGA